MFDDDISLNDYGLTGRIRAMADAGSGGTMASPPGSDWSSGLMQNALALGTSYLSRRIDVDVQGRIAGMQATVQRQSNQRPLNESPDLTTRGVQAVGGVRLGNLLPLLVIGGVVLLLMRK